MATVTVTLTDDDAATLMTVAAGRELTPEELVSRWVKERLVHERERAAGGGQARSPRARRDDAAARSSGPRADRDPEGTGGSG